MSGERWLAAEAAPKGYAAGACLHRLQTCANRASGGRRSVKPAQAGFVADQREAVQAWF